MTGGFNSATTPTMAATADDATKIPTRRPQFGWYSGLGGSEKLKIFER